MIRRVRLVAAFALAAGLNSAGASLAQTQTETGGAPPSASAPDPSLTQSTPLWVPKTDFKPWDPNANAPTYSVTPPQGSSGILPTRRGPRLRQVGGRLRRDRV
jgi:hypothetical protein